MVDVTEKLHVQHSLLICQDFIHVPVLLQRYLCCANIPSNHSSQCLKEATRSSGKIEKEHKEVPHLPSHQHLGATWVLHLCHSAPPPWPLQTSARARCSWVHASFQNWYDYLTLAALNNQLRLTRILKGLCHKPSHSSASEGPGTAFARDTFNNIQNTA